MQTAVSDGWILDLKLPRSKRHHALADMMFDAIRSQQIPPGTRLPTHRELAYRLNTSVSRRLLHTVAGEARALDRGEPRANRP